VAVDTSSNDLTEASERCIEKARPAIGEGYGGWCESKTGAQDRLLVARERGRRTADASGVGRRMTEVRDGAAVVAEGSALEKGEVAMSFVPDALEEQVALARVVPFRQPR